MYQIPTPTRSFSKVACFAHVFGWFSLGGLIFGGLYAFFFARFKFLLFRAGTGIAIGAFCGLLAGITTLFILPKPTLTWQKLALAYFGVILVVMTGFAFWATQGDINDIFDTLSFTLIIFFPTIIAAGVGLWTARWILRWVQRF